MENRYRILQYKNTYEERWDRFIFEKSVNGTFLQSRRFLNYHPVDRFEDASFLVIDEKDNIVAAVPGCIQYKEHRKIFYSHMGSTFGGIVIAECTYIARKVMDIVQLAEEYLKQMGFEKIVYKITPTIFSKEPSDLLEYILFHEKYMEEKELNLFIEFGAYKDNIMSNISRGKKRYIRQCITEGMRVQTLEREEDIKKLHVMLIENLKKYSLKPIHTAEELMLLKNKFIVDECGFYGIFLQEDLVAASMMFYFHNVGIAHSQYLCARPEFDSLSPMSYLYCCMIEEMKRKGFRKLSWGISSEHGGRELNWGLTQSKESYGSKHSINRIFSKDI